MPGPEAVAGLNPETQPVAETEQESPSVQGTEVKDTP